jgi:DNA-binding CsgD family transcriptional regulator
MSTTDKSKSSTSTGISTRTTRDRRFAYRKFVQSLLIGSVEDMKKNKKMEIEAVKWLAGESAGEILDDVEINRKEVLTILKSIVTKDGLEKRFYISKLEKLINETLEDREDV